MRTTALAALGIVAALLAIAGAARAQGLVADLSSHLIAITTGFVGTDVVLFGATDGAGDVVVVVRGPEQEATVRRRGRVAGIWMNVEGVTFENVPSFFVVAANRPLDQMLPAAERARLEIGYEHVRLTTARAIDPARLAEFRPALIREKQEDGLYGREVGQVVFLGEKLFRTNVHFPSNVATGLYTVSVFLVRDGQIVNAQTTPLVVSKTGFSAEIFDFSQRESFYYGLLAVLAAVFAGWTAAAMFRRA
jgi:uncharacterized protein (TIGR02186 family)